MNERTLGICQGLIYKVLKDLGAICVQEKGHGGSYPRILVGTCIVNCEISLKGD